MHLPFSTGGWIMIGYAAWIVVAVLGMAALDASAQGPSAPQPGKVIGPIVGVGRGPGPITPEQEAEDRRNQVKELIGQFTGDDANMRQFAAGQLLRMGKDALPQVQEASDAKGLKDDTRERFAVLLSTLKTDSKRRPAMEKYVKAKGYERADLMPISDEALQKEFPEVMFYALRFRQFPVAHEVPPGMKPSNLYAVEKDGTVVHLANSDELTAFFQKHAPAVKEMDAAKRVARAYVRLAEEWRQDGFFQFTIPDQTVTAQAADKVIKASAKAVASGGGNRGEITATLSFDGDGKLASAKDEGEMHEGVRPICQATKLLDPDPIVRGMARQCVLVMGLRAREYLTEQRAKASPELQKEIDKVWAEIVAEKR
jgi:hypothetical protein